MIIRILLIAGIVAIGWLVFLRRNKLPIHIVTVFALLGAGVVAVLFPDITNDVAEFVGVGRGADLITYITIVLTMFVLVHYYTKFVELQRQLTQVTRELAIFRAEVEQQLQPPCNVERITKQ
jgi:small membrane protein